MGKKNKEIKKDSDNNSVCSSSDDTCDVMISLPVLSSRLFADTASEGGWVIEELMKVRCRVTLSLPDFFGLIPSVSSPSP